MPDTKFIPTPETKTFVEDMLNQRFAGLTDKLIDRINEKDPKLYNRFADPRFLAPLASAHRAFAETGSEELGDTLAGILADLAAEPIRSRKELVLRQALDVAPRLTATHMKSLAVSAHFTHLRIVDAYSTEDLVHTLDKLLRPYYGAILSKAIDYDYMGAAGVCLSDVLGTFSSGPFKVLYNQHLNFMYPPFTLEEIENGLLSNDEDQEESKDEILRALLMPFPATPEDVEPHEGKFAIRKEGARFRVAPDQVRVFLGTSYSMKKDQTTPHRKLRAMIEKRTLSAEDFESLVRRLAPQMAEFFDQLQQTGALNIRINAVGLMLAQHVMKSINPAVAELIDASFADD